MKTKEELEKLRRNSNLEPAECEWCGSLFFRNRIPRGRTPKGAKRFNQKTCSQDCSIERIKYPKNSKKEKAK